MRRFFRWFLMLLAVLLGGALGVRSCAISRYEEAIEEHMAWARGRGEPTTSEELGLRDGGPQDDAAPLFREAAQWLRANGRPGPDGESGARAWVERAAPYFDILRRAANKSVYRPQPQGSDGDTLWGALEAAQMVAMRVSTSPTPIARDLDDIEMLTRIAAYIDRVDPLSFVIAATARAEVASAIRTAASKPGFDAVTHAPRLKAILDELTAWEPMERAALALQVWLFEDYRREPDGRHRSAGTYFLNRLFGRSLHLPQWARNSVNRVTNRPAKVYQITRALDELEAARKRGIDVDTILDFNGIRTFTHEHDHPALGSFLTMLAWSVRDLRREGRLTRLGLVLLVEHQGNDPWPERLDEAKPPMHYARRGEGWHLWTAGKSWVYPKEAESARR